MDKLAGLKLDLLEASKAVETFDVEDIRNMFDQAGYVVEFDNEENCYYAYEADTVAELIEVSIAMIDYLRALGYIGARENI